MNAIVYGLVVSINFCTGFCFVDMFDDVWLSLCVGYLDNVCE